MQAFLQCWWAGDSKPSIMWDHVCMQCSGFCLRILWGISLLFTFQQPWAFHHLQLEPQHLLLWVWLHLWTPCSRIHWNSSWKCTLLKSLVLRPFLSYFQVNEHLSKDHPSISLCLFCLIRMVLTEGFYCAIDPETFSFWPLAKDVLSYKQFITTLAWIFEWS